MGLLLGAALTLASGASAEQFTITQKDRSFAPGEISINVGGEIVFKNDDTVTHNMFSRSDGAKFNLKMQKPGIDESVVIDAAGEHVIRCAIHPKMKLTVKATP